MRTRIITIIIMAMVLVIPLALAESIDCEISIDNNSFGNLNTTMWGGCLDTTNGLAYIQNLDCNTLYYTRCQNETSDWGYQSFTTEDCGENEPMAALAIIIFMLAIVGSLYILPFKVEFSKNKVTAFILKRACWVLATFLLMTTSAIVATIAEAADIAVTQQMFMMMWIAGWAGWLLLLWLVIGSIFEGLKLWKFEKRKGRMGREEL